MCTQLGCIIIGAIVIIIVLSLLFAVVEVWNRSLESTDAHKIKAAVGILFAIVILICILLRTYLDNKRRDIKDIVNVVLFFTCWALLVWVCMCGLFSKKEECATEEIILLRNVAASRNDLVNLTRLNIQTNPLAGQPLESPANFPSSPRSVSPTVIRNNASPNHQRSIDRATIVTYENQIRVLRKQLRRYQYMLEGEPGGSGSSNTNFLGGSGAGISGSNVYSNRSLSGVDTNTGSSQLSFLSDNWDHYRDEKQRSNSFSGGCEGLFVFPTNHRIIHRSFPIKPWLSQRPPLEANNHSSNTVVPTNQMEPSLSLLNEAPSSSETEVPETLQTINTEESVGSPTSYDESMSSNTLGTIESKYSKQSYILI